MPQLTQHKLAQQLKQYSPTDLIRDITTLFQKFENVRDYYQAKFNAGSDLNLIKKYKAIIQKEFFPAHGDPKARLSVARKAVRDYKKIDETPIAVIDLMLFYVENGIRFTLAYGDITESFYSSMEGMFFDACRLISKYKLQHEFRERCEKMIKKLNGNVGWGFEDTLWESFHECFKIS